MENQYSFKQIIKIAAPISVAILIPQLSFLTNTAFLGRLGASELGVNALSGVFYLLLSMLGYGLTSGIQVQMSRRIGEGDHAGLVSLLKHSIVLVLCFSFALMLIASFLVPYLYDVVLHNATNRYLNQAFFKIRIWGLPFLMLTHLFNTFFISINNTTSLIWGSLLSTLTNILFDYLLIFGHAGMPALGIEGAAYASVFAAVAQLSTTDITIITYGAGVHWALEYQQQNKNISLHILDLRTLLPLDYSAIQYAVSVTGKVLILHEDSMFGGLGGEISAWISEHCFENLDAPILRCTSLDTPIPFNMDLEKNYLAKSRLDECIERLMSY